MKTLRTLACMGYLMAESGKGANRRWRTWRIAILCLVVLAMAGTALAQTYLTRTYTELGGLPANMVNDITQDHEGCIWFATRNGVAMYDGIDWHYPTSDNHPVGLDLEYVSTDPNGRVWTVDRSFHVSRFEDGVWRSLPIRVQESKRQYSITSIAFLVKDDQVIFVAGTMQHGLQVFDGTEWSALTTREGLRSNTISDVLSFGNRLYLATPKGLMVLDQDLHQIDIQAVQEQFPSPLVSKLAIEYWRAPDPGGENSYRRLWLLGRDWVGYLDKGVFKKTATTNPLMAHQKEGAFSVFEPDYANGVYYGNVYTLYHLDASGREYTLDSRRGMIADGATSLLLDREYCLWITSPRGVSKIPSMRFSNFRHEEGMLEDEVSAITQVDSTTMLFGHNGGYSLLKEDGSWMTHSFNLPVKPPNHITRVLDILRISRNNYWMAIDAAGMLRVSLADQPEWYSRPFDVDNIASSLVANGAAGCFVASGYGVYTYSAAEDRFVPSHLSTFDSTFVRTIERGTDGSLFIGYGDRGVLQLSHGERTLYVNRDTPAANRIYSLYPEEDGSMLVGTEAGVYRIENGQMLPFPNRKILQDRPAYFVLRDNIGRLWMGSDNGVYIWDGSRTIHFTTIHGLAGLEVNRKAGVVDDRGRVWIGTSSGLSRYDSQFDFTNQIPDPRVQILSVDAGDRSYPPDHDIKLNHDRNSLEVHFRSASFVDERSNSFRYWLEGQDPSWSSVENLVDNELRFSNLLPGRYRLHIQARNALGQWSKVATTRIIQIYPAFWNTWWFALLASGAFLTGLVVVYRMFLQQRYAMILKREVQEKTAQLEQHRDQLEVIVNNRTRELSETNDALRDEIEKREVMQGELERHHTHLESIFNGVHDAILTVDGNGRITRYNRMFARLLNRENENFEGRKLLDYVPAKEVLEAASSGEQVDGWHVILSDRKVGELTLQASAAPLQVESGSVPEVMVVLRDVTRLFQLQREVADRKSYRNIIGQNPRLQEIFTQIEDLSGTLATVLITGESGTGKELIASALHHSSERSSGPFVALNCAALTETILESELFGHVKGAFTGAFRDRAGRFETARGGTLFLDEIGDMAMEMQVKLLRVLETGQFERVGDSVTLHTDARIISATNVDLLKKVEEGTFRKDLYFRLNVIRLHLPPLRERIEDVPLLAMHFVGMFAAESREDIQGISPEALELLMAYDWPGNVRELKHQVQRACLLCRGELLMPQHFPDLLRARTSSNVSRDLHPFDQAQKAGNGNGGFANGDGRLTRESMIEVLEELGWNVQGAARRFGVSRQTMYRKIREFDLKRPGK